MFVPSKTFLIGEYAVLPLDDQDGQGEPAQSVVALTRPFFELRTQMTDLESVDPKSYQDLGQVIHPESPAGKLMELLKFRPEESVESVRSLGHYFDPHRGAGGFGASTAQYIFAERHLAKMEAEKWPLAKLLDRYRQCSSAALVSGHDYLAQGFGQGVVLISTEGPELTSFWSWPFKGFRWALFRTHEKVATHTHLSERIRGTDEFQKLREISRGSELALLREDGESFVAILREYTCELQRLNLRSKKMIDLELEMQKLFPRVAAKGCGAMGADVFMVLSPEESFQETLEWISSNTTFSRVATEEDIWFDLGLCT